MPQSSVLPISNVINVTITEVPSGLTTPNVNSLALFTNEVPSNIDAFRIYATAGEVVADYGTNSVTAAMANAIFAQNPNILSGDGQLVVIPLISSVSATQGQFATTSIAANLAALIAVSNGDLKVTLNSVVNNLANLNFTGCTTLTDIATILQRDLPDAIVSATSTAITIKSKIVGTTSTVALAAFSSGGTDLSGAGFLNVSAGTATAGAASSGETISAAIARTQGQVAYVGVITNLNLEDTAITAIASTIEANDLIFIHHVVSTTAIAGIATTIALASDTRVRLVLYTPDFVDANLMKSAYAGRGFATDFTGSNTAGTLNLQPLVTIDPDPGVNESIWELLNAAGLDAYVNYGGVPGIYSTGGNDFFDNVYGDLALKFALETNGFNFLRQTTTKVPQTEAGMNGLKAAYAAALDQYVRNGSIAPGAWNSSDTFGDPSIFAQNVLNFGYYIYSTPVALQNASDRNARKAPLVQIAVKRAGAIQSSDVLVIVNN